MILLLIKKREKNNLLKTKPKKYMSKEIKPNKWKYKSQNKKDPIIF